MGIVADMRSLCNGRGIELLVSGRFFKNNRVSKVFYNFLGAVKKCLTIFFFLILEARLVG